MTDQADPDARPGAHFARPLGFTLLMVYGLMSFLIGMQDWQGAGSMGTAVDFALILGGALLGSAAIRVLLRRNPAFFRVAVATGGFLLLDLFVELLPGGVEDWRHLAARALLTAIILACVWRADRALPAPARPRDEP